MSTLDEYHSIQSPVETEIKIKASRFIATAAPVESIEAAEKFIESIRTTFPDATHHCYAYRVFNDAQLIERANDDREPSGSAGPPILTVLAGRDLKATIVVVTRYFGGTKLGIGGLIRAYTQATQTALDLAKRTKHIRQSTVAFSFSYDLTGTIMHIINQFKGEIIHSSYAKETQLAVHIPAQSADSFQNQLIDATSNRIQFISWN